MNKVKIYISLMLLPCSGLFAQRSQVQEGRNAIALIQTNAAKNTDNSKQVAVAGQGLKAIVQAKKNRKTGRWSETWAISAYLNAYLSLITPAEISEKYLSQAQSSLDTARLLDKELMHSDLINASLHNINLKKQEKGNAAFVDGDFFRAGIIFKELSDGAPKDTLHAYNAAISAQYIKDDEGAYLLFKRAMEAGITNPAVFQSLSALYVVKMQPDAAISILEQGIRLNPGNSSLKNDHLNLLLDTEQFIKAGLILENMLQYSPGNDRLYYLYGYLNAIQKNGPKAEAAYKKAIYINNNYFDAHYQLGILYLTNSNQLAKNADKKYLSVLNEAAVTLEKAYLIQPNDKKTISLLIEIYKLKGQKDRAAFLQRRLNEF